MTRYSVRMTMFELFPPFYIYLFQNITLKLVRYLLKLPVEIAYRKTLRSQLS